jgi:hypothetical protein
VAKTTIQDPAFGTLTWDASDHVWSAAIPVEYFQKFGNDMPSYGDDEEDEEEGEGEAEESEAGGAGVDVLKGLSGPGGLFGMLTKTDEFKKGMAGLPPEQGAQLQGILGQFVSNVRELTDRADDPGFDTDKLFAEGKFLVTVAAGESKKPPADAQCQGWTAFTAAAPAVFDEVMRRALALYQRQRPARLRWWRAMYGGKSPAKTLPDAKTPAALAKVIRPLEFRVHPGGEVGIHFNTTWDWGDGFGVMVRGRDVVAIGPEAVALKAGPKQDKAKRIDHPVFGPLRLQEGDGWKGVARFDAFGEFYEVAEQRRSRGPYEDKLPPWTPPWNFIEGEFGLMVYVDGKEEPSAAQVEAFRALKADEAETVKTVCDAVMDYYREMYADSAGSGDDDDEDDDDDDEDEDEDGDDEAELAPKSADDLREMMMLQSIDVRRPKRGKSAGVVLNFSCTWDDEHGMSVLWRDGKVEKVDQAAQLDDE